MRANLLLLVLAFAVSVASASPIVDLKTERPAQSFLWDVSFRYARDSARINMVCDMADAPPGAHRISWSMYVHLEDGLLRSAPADVCMPAQEDSCCNGCNGFIFQGSSVPGMPRVYQYAYAGTRCPGICGSDSCDGTRDGTFVYFHVTPDPDYWATQAPGVYYRNAYLEPGVDPGSMNLWTCCDGVSGITCDDPSMPFMRLGYHIGHAIRVRIVVPLLATGALAESEEGNVRSADPNIEPLILEQITAAQNSSWGCLKAKFAR